MVISKTQVPADDHCAYGLGSMLMVAFGREWHESSQLII